ncbi:hypothetical protein ACF0H5_023438 [Mactra antiquata]
MENTHNNCEYQHEDVEMTLVSSKGDNIDQETSAKQKDNLRPDDVLQRLGGCGLFQVLLCLVVHCMKLAVAWGMGSNSFFAFVPRWRCSDILPVENVTSGLNNDLVYHNANLTSTTEYWNQKCQLPTGEKCQNFEFEDSIHTIVSRFNLVCDKSWVTASIISMQMAGIGSAFYLSIYCILQGEYVLSKWRSTVIGLPTWAISMCVFTLFAWLIQDWRWVTLIISLGALTSLTAWCFIPESFRWLVARDRFNEARQVVRRLEKLNRRTAPEFDKIVQAFSEETAQSSENYSVLVLFRNKSLLKITLPLMTGWLSLGLISYGIGFGVKKFSGNFFFNLFLFSILSIPSKAIAMYLQNVIGRKYTAVIAFMICLIGGCVVGIIQYVDTPNKGALSNGFALAASAGVDAAWGPMQTLTVELYPTVARTTGFGFLSVLARLGAVIGPQFVYLEDYVPGLLYFVVAGISAVSLCCVLCLPETMNTTLVDKLSENEGKQRRKE